MAVCNHCGEEIPKTRRKDSKTCSTKCSNSSTSRKYYYKNQEVEIQKRRDYNLNVEKRCLTRLKSRCKKTGQVFNLEAGDLIFPSHCPVLGLELKYDNKGKGYKDDGYSVDKIVPTLGYTKGNVRVISSRANLLKNNASVEELEKVLEDLKKWQCLT